jgi:hypothetical protein
MKQIIVVFLLPTGRSENFLIHIVFSILVSTEVKKKSVTTTFNMVIYYYVLNVSTPFDYHQVSLCTKMLRGMIIANTNFTARVRSYPLELKWNYKEQGSNI